MIEIVEANVLANQMNKTILGKRISGVTTLASPHKFAFFHGEPESYEGQMKGKCIGEASPKGGQLKLEIEDLILVFGDGVDLRYLAVDMKRPAKHQLLIDFDDGSALSGSVQMYGFMLLTREEEFDNPYYLVAKEKPSPLTEQFDYSYFLDILSAPGAEKLSAKAVLATEQRIPGLGNGVLQDILYRAGLHPKRKVGTFTEADKERLYRSIKTTLSEMIQYGGRDTEKDLYGNQGGYITSLSKNTVGKTCPNCGHTIQKEAYLGGSIYYCDGCQPMVK
jgi:formamidopyrimidine-DNA glycosylase